MSSKNPRLVVTATEVVRVRHHIAEDQLRSYVDGGLTGPERNRIRRHLEGCLDCSLNAGRV